MINSPLSSVDAPRVVPARKTFAPLKFIFDRASITCPCIVPLVDKLSILLKSTILLSD